jgi:DnaJ-class molecular chaperone
MRTPFEILSVPENATDEEIKRSYRKLAMKWHPDRNADNIDESEKNFKEVKEAFEQIETEQKRSQWHMEQNYKNRSKHKTTRSSYSDSQAFDDVFADLFKDVYGRTSKNDQFHDFADAKRKMAEEELNRRRQSVKNADAHIEIAITLEEAFHGKEVAVTYKTPDGETRQVLLDIPSGIIDGKVVRCKTAGSRKNTDTPSGDLLATIKIKPHKLFIRESQNIVMHVDVPALDMLAGGSARITTIEGTEFDINIRSCTQPGTRIRIPEHGMRVMGSRLRGDMFIELNVVWPASMPEDVLNHLKAARDLTLPKTV